MLQRWRLPRRTTVSPYLALTAAIILALVLSPPSGMVDLIGSDGWARAALGLLLFLALCMVLTVLGLADIEVSLPFGLGIKRGASVDMLQALRNADDALFADMGALAEAVDDLRQRSAGADEQLAEEP
jgi:hypothetical protein